MVAVPLEPTWSPLAFLSSDCGATLSSGISGSSVPSHTPVSPPSKQTLWLCPDQPSLSHMGHSSLNVWWVLLQFHFPKWIALVWNRGVCLASSAQLPLPCLFLHASLGLSLILSPLSCQRPWELHCPPFKLISEHSVAFSNVIHSVGPILSFMFVASVSWNFYVQNRDEKSSSLYYVPDAFQCPRLILFTPLKDRKILNEWGALRLKERDLLTSPGLPS